MTARDPMEDSELGEQPPEWGRRPVRQGPLIAKTAPDIILRTLVAALVALMTFLCGFAWSGNRELGEMRAEYRANTAATAQRITALENATDRRLSALERRVWEGGQ